MTQIRLILHNTSPEPEPEMAKRKTARKTKRRKSTRKTATAKTKKGAAAGGGGKKGRGRNAQLNCDQALYEVVGIRKGTRAQIIKKMWAYIHKHNLQNPVNKNKIFVDKKLAAICGPERKKGEMMNAHKMGKHIKKHAF